MALSGLSAMSASLSGFGAKQTWRDHCWRIARSLMTQCMVRPCVARGLRQVGGCAVLHQCIRPLIGAFELRAIMDISARATSLADRSQWAIWVTSVRKRREDRSSISFLILSQTSAGKMSRRLADHATSILLASNARPRARTLQAMRASLLASAIARTL